MGKKSRRRRGAQRPRLSPAQLVQPVEQPTASAASVSPTVRPAASSARAMRDLRDEYPYVVSDLRRIAIIAGVMLAVLIGLAFLLV